MQVFHGEDQIKSREAYIQAKSAVRNGPSQVLELQGDNLTLAQLINAVETGSLFGPSNIIFIESVLSRRPSNEKTQILEYLSGCSAKELYIWEPKDVTTHLKNFSSAQIKKFDLPKYIFNFLDHLDTHSFQKCLESQPVEMLFASVATRLHKVIINQGNFRFNYTPSTLKKMNSDLLAIDYRQKTSTSPMDLSAALEVWLVKLHNEVVDN